MTICVSVEAHPRGLSFAFAEMGRDRTIEDLPDYPHRMAEDLLVVCQNQWNKEDPVQVCQGKNRDGVGNLGDRIRFENIWSLWRWRQWKIDGYMIPSANLLTAQ